MSTPLLIPRNAMSALVENESSFEELINQLALGNGPIAIDAERASGYRYSQRAYLIQIYRKDGGLHLIDPIPLKDSKLWEKFNKQFSSCEWVIHASTQDLPCLIEVGLKPTLLFDTELGARIAGCERVGLGALAESLLELTLAKEHSAVDWSIRPLKPEWITYAALDVDILLDIRNAVEDLLTEQKKLKWAQRYKKVVVIEDGIKHGGIASTISELFRESGLNVPVHSIGVPLEFLEHAKRAQILEDLGITVQNITRSLVTWSSDEFSVDTKEEMPLPLDENEHRKPLR